MTASPSSKLIVRGTGRPAGYYDSHGRRVPSVTTITGARKAGIEGLLVWANRLGQEGKDHRDVRQEAADAGSLAHTMVENAIHERDPLEGVSLPSDPAVLEQAKAGFAAYCEWAQAVDLTFVATEQPLVSDEYQFGGTFDAVAITKDGEHALCDWKTSGRVYGDYIIQMGAYRFLWELHHPGRLIKKCYLLRFGKEHGDFHFHSYTPDIVEMGWQAFLKLRELYDLDKRLAKVAS